MKDNEQKSNNNELDLRGLAEEDMASILDELAMVTSTIDDTLGSKEEKESSTEVIIGEGRNVKFPLLLTHSLFVDANRMANVNKAVRIAAAYGSSMVQIPINVGEGILSEEKKIEKKFQGDFILQWSPIRMAIDTTTLGMAKSIVIDLTWKRHSRLYTHDETLNRVKGKGGLISGDSIGPVSHLDIEEMADLKKHVDLLRESTEYNLPIMIKIPSGALYENTKASIEAEPDAIIIDTSMDPFSTLASLNGTFGTSILGSIQPAKKAFKASSAQKKGIKLLVSGGFRNGADILKVLAMGADAVGITESAVVAMGCNLCGECPKGKCQMGIATKDSRLKSNFDWKIAGKNLADYLKTTKHEMELLQDVIGVIDVKDLTSDHVRALTYDTAAITGIKLIGYDRELPMWFH
ncbi:MAG: alpha-hydroxy-acid oxidizing protein [Thermoplasmata archaeon]|nr:MAG: alpha-hydroxy-acid oxidizing protein [Thermoplasmata archaeon]